MISTAVGDRQFAPPRHLTKPGSTKRPMGGAMRKSEYEQEKGLRFFWQYSQGSKDIWPG